MKIRLLIGAFSCWLFSSVCFANDGSYGYQGNGGVVMAVKNNAISMENEDIKIEVIPTDFSQFDVVYDCQFNFKNKTRKEQKVIMGFPHKLDTWDTSQGKLPTDSALSDFKFYIDGKETEFQINRNVPNPDIKTVPAYDVVCTIELTFKPDEIKVIRNTYTMSFSHFEDLEAEEIRKPNDPINYILKTGLTWNGPIGLTNINVIFDLPEDYLEITSNLSGFKMLKNPTCLRYQYKNFKPTEDLHIGIKYKKLTMPEALKQIKAYYDQQDYIGAYYLLKKLAATTRLDIKANVIKDVIRNLACQTARKLCEKEPEKAIDLFHVALQHCRSFTPETDRRIFYPDDEFLAEKPFANWVDEGETNSPCYYITGNIACVYARLHDYDESKIWMDVTYSLKPELPGFMLQDEFFADVLRKDTPFITACKTSLNFDSFLTQNEDINQRGANGVTPFMALLMHLKDEDCSTFELSLIQKFISAGVDPSLKDVAGWSCLDYAIYVFKKPTDAQEQEKLFPEYMRIIDQLIQGGADIHDRDHMVRTLLHNLPYYGEIAEVVKQKLISLTSDIDIRAEDGSTPLMSLLSTDHPSISLVQAFLDKKANVNLQDKSGKTPLMRACSATYKSPEVIELLIKNGANLNLKDKAGKTAFIHYLDNRGGACCR